MQIYIRPSSSLVAIDDASINNIDCSSIPANVELVIWNSPQSGGGQGSQGQGSGQVLYNDRIAIREPFTDVTPYLGAINNWIKAAAGQLGPAPGQPAAPSAPHPVSKPVALTAQQITTVQAQAVKNNLLDALFAVKRQAPFTYNGNTYDASDSEVSAMSNAVTASAGANIDSTNSALSALTGSVNAAFTGLIGTGTTAGSINKVLTDHNTSADAAVQGVASSANSSVTTLASNAQSGDAHVASTFNTAWLNHISDHTTDTNSFLNQLDTDVVQPLQTAAGGPVPGTIVMPGFPLPGTPSGSSTTVSAPGVSAPHTTMGAVNSQSVSTAALTGPSIPWSSTDGVQQNLTFTQFTEGLLSGITNRRATLQSTHLSMKSAIAALTDPVSVANYNITAGW